MNNKLLSILLNWVSLYREKNMSYKEALTLVNYEYKIEAARFRYRRECNIIRNFKNLNRRSGQVPKIKIQVCCSGEKSQDPNPYNEYGLDFGFSKPREEDEQDCPICLETIFKNDAVKLGCDHVCCKTCMRSIITKQSKFRCFMCRSEVKSIQVKSKWISKTLQQYYPKSPSKITATDILYINSPEYVE